MSATGCTTDSAHPAGSSASTASATAFDAASDGPIGSTLCPTDPYGSTHGLTDIDHSGADFAVGAPRDTWTVGESQGSIELRMTSTGSQHLQDGTYGAPDRTTMDDHWGSAIVISNLDRDSCADIVVGAPAPGHMGHVTILHGSPVGAAVTPFELLTAPHPAWDDLYGSALAVARDRKTGRSILWVGAPGTTVNDVEGAGALYRYVVSPAGRVTLDATFSEASSIIGLAPAEGDHFGQVLSASPDGGVTIGVPNRDVGAQRDAGAVVRIVGSYDSGPATSAQVVTQDMAGVPDAAEAGDRFGAAMDAGGRYVGVPGEDLRALRDAGMVQTFNFDAASRLVPGRVWTASSAGVPSRAGAGDRFGASVASGFGVACHSAPAVVVGAPGMDQGAATDAGAVVVLPSVYGSGNRCRGALLQQGRGLPGAPESGDHVGASLSTVVDGLRGQDDEADSVVIGAPGEDIDGQKDAGRALLLRGSGSEGWMPYSQGAVEIDSALGPAENTHFGDVLSVAPAG